MWSLKTQGADNRQFSGDPGPLPAGINPVPDILPFLSGSPGDIFSPSVSDPLSAVSLQQKQKVRSI
jgi:hypothetical protein